jgi:ABC-type Fe3+/spermidine/putrescine transport system ATPase subunit
MTAFVDAREVTKRRAGRAVVDAVSLTVAAGESVVIVGPSGSGKTTLLRIVAGLEVPDEGEVWVGSTRVSAQGRILVPPHERRIGFVFQDLALWPHMTIEQHVAFVLQALGVLPSERGARGREALARARVEHLATRYPHQLSGGEQQRAALARAIVSRPRLLLLDEPFSNLDPELRLELGGELLRVRAELELTVLHVTHDRQGALELGDRIVEMRAGRLRAVDR